MRRGLEAGDLSFFYSCIQKNNSGSNVDFGRHGAELILRRARGALHHLENYHL